MVYFQAKNSDLGKFWERLATEDVGTYILWTFGKFSVHLVYFVDIWDVLWPLWLLCGHLEYFFVLVCCAKKNLAALKGRQVWVQIGIVISQIMHFTSRCILNNSTYYVVIASSSRTEDPGLESRQGVRF
jgi:hypothetical protein